MKRRSVIAGALTAIAAAVAATFLVAGSSAAPPTPLQANLTELYLSGANQLELGYVYKGRNVLLSKSAGYGTTASLASATADYKAAGTLVMYLRDVTCNAIYYSNGTGTADHAWITTSSTPYVVTMSDAGGECANKRVDAGVPADNGHVYVSPSTALDLTGND